jgi:ribonuclease Y
VINRVFPINYGAAEAALKNKPKCGGKMDVLLLIPMLVVVIIIFYYLGWMMNSRIGKKSIITAEEQAKKILEDADKEAKNLKREKLLEVKDEWYKKKTEFDKEVQQKKQKIGSLEKQIQLREENSEKKFDLVLQKERENKKFEQEINEQRKLIEKKLEGLGQLEQEQNSKLEKISGLSSDEAKKILMDNLVNQAKMDAAHLIKEITDRAKAEGKREAQKIIVQSIQRTAADHSIESTVSVVQIQNDEMKGRIIGKEGRNIRSFESSTGVDVIVDDTPEAVILSSFDQFRREVARVSLERLIADGRIHPARIEEVVDKVKQELEEEMIRDGESVVMQLGLHNMHNELIKHIGKMKYRSSFGQNLMQHSIEVAYLTGIMAAELGMETNLAKRAGLLHDVGKTVDKSVEGPHALIGYEITKRYNEHAIVVNAVGSHHEDIEMEHPIAALVQDVNL